MKFTITHLADLAAHFEQRETSQLEQAARATEKVKRELEIRAAVWREAAEIVRKTELEG